MFQNGHFDMHTHPKSQFTIFCRHILRLSSLAVLLSTAAIASAAIILDDDQQENAQPADNPGLFGILPDLVPKDLTTEEFALLDNNWAEWSEEVSYLIADIYEDDTLGFQGQRKKLASLKIKLQTMEQAIDDPSYSQLYLPLVMLHSRLKQRVDFANAILDTLTLDVEKIKQARISSSAEQLRKASSELEQEMNSIKRGSAWLNYMRTNILKQAKNNPASLKAALNVQQKLANKNQLSDAEQKAFISQPVFANMHKAINHFVSSTSAKIKPSNPKLLRDQLAELVAACELYSSLGLQADAARINNSLIAISKNTPDEGATINEIINRYYRGNNLRVTIGEDFLTRILGETTSDHAQVDDYFNGARSIGTSNTTVTVSADIKPSNNGILFDIVLDGNVYTNTTSYASQANARIYATGHHTFRGSRELHFDGDQIIATSPTAEISVNPCLNIYGAGTKYDGIPLLGSHARNTAFRTAQSRRYSSEQHAANKIRERVVPEFQAEMDNRLPELNDKLATGIVKRLKNVGLFPTERSYSSTDDQMMITSLVNNKSELGGGVPNYEAAPTNGIHLAIHESMMNNMTNRLNLAGRTMNEDDVKQEIESFVTKLTGSEFQFKQGDDSSKAKSEKDSSSFVFDKSDPVRLDIEGGRLNLTLRCGIKQNEPGKEDIPPHAITIAIVVEIKGDEIIFKRDAVKVSAINDKDGSRVREGVIRKKIAAAFPERKRSRLITLKRDDKPDLDISIEHIRAINGWLSIQAH